MGRAAGPAGPKADGAAGPADGAGTSTGAASVFARIVPAEGSAAAVGTSCAVSPPVRTAERAPAVSQVRRFVNERRMLGDSA
jgi:hypothetical protein